MAGTIELKNISEIETKQEYKHHNTIFTFHVLCCFLLMNLEIRQNQETEHAIKENSKLSIFSRSTFTKLSRNKQKPNSPDVTVKLSNYRAFVSTNTPDTLRVVFNSIATMINIHSIPK